jgi:shikimate dehydrogenase
MPAFPIANRTKRVLLGLIGSPIAHSAAPAMHEAAARAARGAQQ